MSSTPGSRSPSSPSGSAPALTDPSNAKPSQTVRKPKSTQACASCRKQKTRCEFLDEQEKSCMRCHRCTTLRLECSLEVFAEKTKGPEHLQVFKKAPADFLNDEMNHIRPGMSPLGPPLGKDGAPKSMVNYTGGLFRFITPDVNDPIDWSSPTLAMQDLLSRINVPVHPLPPASELLLENVLDHSMITNLLGIFTKYYEPWLHFEPLKNAPTPTLDIVRCSIASRHLPSTTHSRISQTLGSMVDTYIASILNCPTARTTELVQALLISSMWGPLREDAQGPIKDGRLLINMAVGMAMSLRLNQMSTILVAQEGEKDENLLNQARLWIAICNAESLMCLGSGSLPTSRHSPSDRTLFRHSPVGTLVGGRDMRLHIQCLLYGLAEMAWCVDFGADTPLDQTSPAFATAAENWNKNVGDIHKIMESLNDAISPLPAIADHENFHFTMLKFVSLCCQLSYLFHVLFEARYAHQDLQVLGIDWIPKAHSGLQMLPALFRTISKTMEDVIEMALVADTTLFCTAPDAVFRQISLAGALLVGRKFLLRFYKPFPFIEARDQLLYKLIEKFSPASGQFPFTADHPAAKTGKLIELVMRAWNNWKQQQMPNSNLPTEMPTSLRRSADVPEQQMQALDIDEPSMFVGGAGPAGEHVLPNQNTFEMFDQLISSEGMQMDSQFWESMAGYSYDTHSGGSEGPSQPMY